MLAEYIEKLARDPNFRIMPPLGQGLPARLLTAQPDAVAPPNLATTAPPDGHRRG